MLGTKTSMYQYQYRYGLPSYFIESKHRSLLVQSSESTPPTAHSGHPVHAFHCLSVRLPYIRHREGERASTESWRASRGPSGTPSRCESFACSFSYALLCHALCHALQSSALRSSAGADGWLGWVSVFAAPYRRSIGNFSGVPCSLCFIAVLLRTPYRTAELSNVRGIAYAGVV